MIKADQTEGRSWRVFSSEFNRQALKLASESAKAAGEAC